LTDIPPEQDAPSGFTQQFPGRHHSPRRRPPGSGLRSAIIVTVVATIVCIVATYELIRAELSTTLAEISAVVALLSFGVGVYGILQIILALIESAGERRRIERETSERRAVQRPDEPPLT
jgi:hypothetical protein